MRPSRLLKSVVMLYRPLGKDRHWRIRVLAPKTDIYTGSACSTYEKVLYTPEAQKRIHKNDTEKLPSNAPAGATYNVETDKRDTTLDSPRDIVPFRRPMTRSITRNVKEL
ncbi:hypothetical protein TNCV_1413711 [Trichonephila clavipes]|nr:hypothetical protein TNCV_1413711 [Trichonephila clavipes]